MMPHEGGLKSAEQVLLLLDDNPTAPSTGFWRDVATFESVFCMIVARKIHHYEA